MKRDQCLLSAKRLTENDAKAVSRFRTELGELTKLERSGHSRECARQMVFGEGVIAQCICKRERRTP